MAQPRPPHADAAAPGAVPGPPPDLHGRRALELADEIDVVAGVLTRISDVWLSGARPTTDELRVVARRLETLHRSITGLPLPEVGRRAS